MEDLLWFAKRMALECVMQLGVLILITSQCEQFLELPAASSESETKQTDMGKTKFSVEIKQDTIDSVFLKITGS